MADDNQNLRKWKVATTGTIILAAILVATMLVEAPAYYCDLLEPPYNIAHCDRLSDSGKTCYWNVVNTTTGEAYEEDLPCRKGRTWHEWQLVEEVVDAPDDPSHETKPETLVNLPLGTLMTTRTSSGVYDCELYETGITNESKCYDGWGNYVNTYSELE